MNWVRFAQNWNVGILQWWNHGPLRQWHDGLFGAALDHDVTPPRGKPRGILAKGGKGYSKASTSSSKSTFQYAIMPWARQKFRPRKMCIGIHGLYQFRDV
jgi:hypothetical protein